MQLREGGRPESEARDGQSKNKQVESYHIPTYGDAVEVCLDYYSQSLDEHVRFQRLRAVKGDCELARLYEQQMVQPAMERALAVMDACASLFDADAGKLADDVEEAYDARNA